MSSFLTTKWNSLIPLTHSGDWALDHTTKIAFLPQALTLIKKTGICFQIWKMARHVSFQSFFPTWKRSWHWVAALINAKSQDQAWDNERSLACWSHLASLLSHPTLLDLSFFVYKMNGLGEINSFPRWSSVLMPWDYLSWVPRNKWQYHNNDKTGMLRKWLTLKK